MPAHRLFIATPTADGIVLARYIASLAHLVMHLHTHGIGVEYHTLDGRDVVVQRDELANRFLSSPCTHLLFIDSDMAFPPTLAERLVAFDKPLVGRGGLPLYDARGRARPLRSFFQEARVGEGIVDGDYSFCRRWIACGGEVLAYLDAEVRHLGDFRPALPFLAHLQARAAAQAP